MIVYVACADSGEISVLSLDAGRAQLAPVQTLPVGSQVMPLAVSPDRRRLYAALRGAPHAVVTLRIAQAMKRLGWQFGQELGFVGFDDPEWASLIGPGLSTVAQPTDEIGRAAASCLIERLHGLEGPAREMLLPGRLQVRGSSAAALKAA